MSWFLLRAEGEGSALNVSPSFADEHLLGVHIIFPLFFHRYMSVPKFPFSVRILIMLDYGQILGNTQFSPHQNCRQQVFSSMSFIFNTNPSI
jgi:hypothetical protein